MRPGPRKRARSRHGVPDRRTLFHVGTLPVYKRVATDVNLSTAHLLPLLTVRRFLRLNDNTVTEEQRPYEDLAKYS